MSAFACAAEQSKSSEQMAMFGDGGGALVRVSYERVTWVWNQGARRQL